MPTFGKTTAGSSSAGRTDSLACKYTVPENCNVNTVSVYLKDQDGQSTQANVAIYSHDAGNDLPLNKLAEGTPIAISAANDGSWLTFGGFNLDLNAGDVVWLAARGNLKISWSWDAGTRIVDSLDKNDIAFQNTWLNGGSSWALDMAIYATYTASGGVAYDETGRAMNIVSADGLTDKQSYKEALNFNIVSAQALSALANYVERLSAIAIGPVTLSDRQNFKERVLSLLQTAQSVTDRQKYLELLGAVAQAIITATDTKSGALLEQLLVSITSAPSIKAAQKYVEKSGFSIATITRIAERLSQVELLSIIAQMDAAVTDKQAYKDSAGSYEVEAVGKNTVYDLPPIPNNGYADFNIAFLLYIPHEISPNNQGIFTFSTSGSGGQSLELLLSGKTVYLFTSDGTLVNIDANAGCWNVVSFSQEQATSTYTLFVNESSLSFVANPHLDRVNFKFLAVADFGSGFYDGEKDLFGDPGYKIANVRGAYNFGKSWQDAAKTIPAGLGDNINTIENHGDVTSGDIVLTSGYTAGIKRGYTQYFNAATSVRDIQKYIETLQATAIISVNIIEVFSGAILESLGFNITSQALVKEVQHYTQKIGFTIASGAAASDLQKYVEKIFDGLVISLNIHESAGLAERLQVVAQLLATETDQQKYVQLLDEVIASYIKLNETFTPLFMPLVRFEFKVLPRVLDFEKAAINKDFTKTISKNFDY